MQNLGVRSGALVAATVAMVAALVLPGSASAASSGSLRAPNGASAATKSGQATSRARPLSAQEQRQHALLPVAQKVVGQATSPGSDIAGVEIDQATNTVRVYRTDPQRQLGFTVPAGVQVEVHGARFSRAVMLAAGTRMTRDAVSLGQQYHILIEAVGPTVDGSGVTVTVLASGKRAASQLSLASRLLHQRYGAIVARVYGVQSKPSASNLYFSGFRFNDFAPWYGGDRIVSSTVGCSTGFYAVYNSAPVMLTASHCGGVGTTFYNGPRSNGTYSTMGNSVYSNTGTDVGAIGVTSATSLINVGSALSPTQLYVPAWGSPVVGQYLCQSGSYTGEVCGLRVVDTGQSVCLSTFLWWCTSWQGPLADVINSAGSGSYAAGHGDSGGPVYLRTGSSGLAEGLVHGQLTPNAQAAYPAYFPDTMWCPAPEGWQQRCSAGFSFADMPGY
jgi:hypothetical protein